MLAVTVFWTTVTASAATISIGFKTPGMAAAVPPANVIVRARSENGTTTEATLPLAQGGTMVLAPGLWEVALTATGFWSQPSAVRVGTGDSSTTLTLFPAATVRGEISMTGKPPRALTIYFQPAPSDTPSGLPAASVECPIVNKRWTCEVPAGALDLAFRAPGFVTVYRWNERLAPASTENLGIVALRPGASLSGSVSFAERLAKPPKVTVTVWQQAGSPQTFDRRDRDRLRRLLSTPNARGFFDFTLAPGSYTIQASAGELISEAREVRVVDGREAMLRDPLVLEKPRTFSLQLTPPTDPTRKPWSIVLQKVDRNNVVENEVTAVVPATGRWEASKLTPGHYALSIRRTPGDLWHFEELDLAGDMTREINLDLGMVKGTVTLGGKPLKAAVWFGGEHGQPRIPIFTHDDGTFRLLLPMPAHDLWWAVDVNAEQPYVRRSLTDVVIKRHEKGPATIDIDLPTTLVVGEVVDAEGAVRKNAIINITASNGATQQILSESGTFTISGLPAGPTALRAETREDESDAPQEVDVRDDDAINVKLIVKPRSLYDGIVTSTNGPVASATVTALPLDFRFRNVGRFPADEDGHFTLPLPPGTRDSHVYVSAPGYAFRMMRAQKPAVGPLVVLLDAQGGTLIIESPRRDSGDLLPVVLHNGAAMPALTLAWLADGDSGPYGAHGFRATYPLVEEGPYAVCWMTIAAAGSGTAAGGRCTNGLLPRGGSLTLTAPEP